MSVGEQGQLMSSGESIVWSEHCLLMSCGEGKFRERAGLAHEQLQ